MALMVGYSSKDFKVLTLERLQGTNSEMLRDTVPKSIIELLPWQQVKGQILCHVPNLW